MTERPGAVSAYHYMLGRDEWTPKITRLHQAAARALRSQGNLWLAREHAIRATLGF